MPYLTIAFFCILIAYILAYLMSDSVVAAYDPATGDLRGSTVIHVLMLLLIVITALVVFALLSTAMLAVCKYLT